VNYGTVLVIHGNSDHDAGGGKKRPGADKKRGCRIRRGSLRSSGSILIVSNPELKTARILRVYRTVWQGRTSPLIRFWQEELIDYSEPE